MQVGFTDSADHRRRFLEIRVTPTAGTEWHLGATPEASSWPTGYEQLTASPEDTDHRYLLPAMISV